MPEEKDSPKMKREMKTVEFTPKRQKEVRAAAVQAKEMLFDLETGNVYFTGRGQFAIQETVMSLTLLDVANLAAQMLNISVATLVNAIETTAVANALSSPSRQG